MGKKHTKEELLRLLDEQKHHIGHTYRHVESGVLYMVVDVEWSVDLQKPTLVYYDLSDLNPDEVEAETVLFTRDHSVFDGSKFTRVV